ncbi:MAG: HD-GYP domain-containing protein [Gammaproteobacteria bacterium]|nr:HD-GYP domain-containing protein [Gammaproteobacteria bacterium]
MALTNRKLSAGELCMGMYVRKLDRPWLGTPFLMQGFLIKDKEEIKTLQSLCKHVYIDEVMGKQSLIDAPHKARPSKAKYSRDDLIKLFPSIKLKTYIQKKELDQEIIPAKRAYSDLEDSISSMIQAHRKGMAIPYQRLRQAITPMVNSIIRNPNATMWLARMKSADNYIYQHSLSTSVWSVILGRQIGLPTKELESLAIGALLCDIGMLNIPFELIKTPGKLSDDNIKIIQTHVSLSIDALEAIPGIRQQDMMIVSNHHERCNGQGYPKGIGSRDIPVMAKIVSIADSYDAMISHRPHISAKSPVIAIKQLYELRGSYYQAELVEEFIQAVGIFPTGTLIELSTGHIAIVVAENKTRRLRPKILMLLDENKKPIKNASIIDLMTPRKSIYEAPVLITKSLEPGAYGIRPEEIFFRF